MDRPIAVDLAARFMSVFAGMDRAYGTYDLTNGKTRDEDGKIEGQAYTKQAPVTEQLWESHLSGKGVGLGIIPIRDGNDCKFGAIDVDVYKGQDLQAIVAKLRQHKLPLIVCRSKSGGAHIYCFSKNPVSAANMKSKLSEVASFLGYGKCEIFPKQTSILSEKGDMGQWINVPYFNGIRGMRYAVDIEGNALTPDEFLFAAESLMVDDAWFTQLLVMSTEFEDGPPCLQALSQVGYPAGTRNDGLYNIGVYLKKSKPDSWERELEDMNHKYLRPPLTIPEIQGLIKSLKRKDYMYGCTKQPIVQHCNATLCRTRKFGVGSSAAGRFPMLGGLTKLNTKPPIWFWTVDGTRMELSTADIQDPRAFQRRCMDYLNVMPQIPGAPIWQAAVQHAMDNVSIVDAPADASPEGQFWEMAEQFCSRRAQALVLEEIMLGKPFTENKKTYFRMQDLMGYLTQHKFFHFQGPKIASMLKDAGAEHHFDVMKGRGVNYWSIPSFAKQTESFSVPDDVKGSESIF